MNLLSILLTAILCATASAQTIKTLGYNTTNGQVVANTGTNVLSFELGNGVVIGGDNGTKLTVSGDGLSFYSQTQSVNVLHIPADDTVQLNGGYWNDPSVRASLGFSTNLNTLWTATNASNARSAVGLGATWLTNTNVTNFRTAVGLGEANSPTFTQIQVSGNILNGSGFFYADNTVVGLNLEEGWIQDVSSNNVLNWGNGTDLIVGRPLVFGETAPATRTNLGLPLPALTNTNNVTAMRALAGSTNTNEPYSGTVALTNTNVLTFSNGVLLKIQ